MLTLLKPLSEKEKMAKFGPLKYTKKEGGIVLTGTWEKDNLVKCFSPLLSRLGFDGPHLFHKKGASQFVALFKAIERQGLSKYLLQWNGTFKPELVPGSTIISSTTFGIAININMNWNKFGQEPPHEDSKGTVYPMIALASEYGFAWAGNNTTPKGSQFELAKLL